MKKFSLIALFAALVAVNVNATELWTGSHAVTWDTPLNLNAATFADAVAGQKIVAAYTDASDGIECKVLDVLSMVPGLKKDNWISGDGTFEFILTQPALEALQAHGLQLIGNHFTLTSVELVDGRVLHEGTTIWAGFFWANDWDNSTLVLNKETATSVDWSGYSAVRVYHEAGRDNFEVNLKRNWDNAGFIVGTDGNFAETMTVTDAENHSYKEFALTDAARTAATVETDEFIMQCYKGDNQAAFNITDIVLVMEEDGGATAIENTVMGEKAVKTFENGQLVIIKNGVKYNALGAEIR